MPWGDAWPPWEGRRREGRNWPERECEWPVYSSSTELMWKSREGNANPLQYSCLEGPTDREACWAAVHEDRCKELDVTEHRASALWKRPQAEELSYLYSRVSLYCWIRPLLLLYKWKLLSRNKIRQTVCISCLTILCKFWLNMYVLSWH